MTPPVLTTDRLVLRPLSADDFEALAAFYASDRSRHVGGPKDRADTWRQLAAEIGHWTLRGYGRWGVDVAATGACVGIVGCWNPEGWPEPELGWDLFDGHEGRGYATEAAAAARRWAYDAAGWRTAISLVSHGNGASARVAARLGCLHEADVEGRFGGAQIWRHPGPAAVL
ncbi:GNAT family N-acetyltransferase [Jannaschia sp. LMIT008]|uniref:GNAT family N-acetyltransferase n=1 Tax=Jannaschia maritima TaxID=3032585 RepID=UPI002811281C|nr:GNAT family N-acetyltransferase [Jannaschia sp. LMIT008]